MQRIARGLISLVIAVAALTASSPASACTLPAPRLAVNPTTARAGTSVAVVGESIWEIDPNPPTTTSTSASTTIPQCGPVMQGGPVELWFVQGATVVLLATAQPDEEYELAATVVVPASAGGGIARIEAVADYLDPAPVAELVIFADPPRVDPPRVEPRYAG